MSAAPAERDARSPSPPVPPPATRHRGRHSTTQAPFCTPAPWRGFPHIRPAVSHPRTRTPLPPLGSTWRKPAPSDSHGVRTPRLRLREPLTGAPPAPPTRTTLGGGGARPVVRAAPGPSRPHDDPQRRLRAHTILLAALAAAGCGTRLFQCPRMAPRRRPQSADINCSPTAQPRPQAHHTHPPTRHPTSPAPPRPTGDGVGAATAMMTNPPREQRRVLLRLLLRLVATAPRDVAPHAFTRFATPPHPSTTV